MSDRMKSIPLRTLVRDTKRVKRMTAGGSSVQVTDGGKPLWVIRGAEESNSFPNPERDRAIDELLDEMLAEAPSSLSLSKVIIDGRQ